MADLVSDVINKSFVALGVIQPGGSITTAIQTDAFSKLNDMWASWGTEAETSNASYHQTFSLTAGQNSYLFGMGAALNATANPVMITGAESVSGNFRSPVRVCGFDEFDTLASDTLGGSTVLCNLLAQDPSFPNINVRVHPVPATSPGSLVLDYYGAMAPFTSVGQTLNLAPEYELALWTNLAVLLYSNYARANFDPTSLFAQAQNAKKTIAVKNTSINQPTAAPAS